MFVSHVLSSVDYISRRMETAMALVGPITYMFERPGF